MLKSSETKPKSNVQYDMPPTKASTSLSASATLVESIARANKTNTAPEIIDIGENFLTLAQVGVRQYSSVTFPHLALNTATSNNISNALAKAYGSVALAEVITWKYQSSAVIEPSSRPNTIGTHLGMLLLIINTSFEGRGTGIICRLSLHFLIYVMMSPSVK
jgi:predicted polyphosphate/ATP-dependent NAD kinase